MRVFENTAVVGMHFRGAAAKEIASASQPGDTFTLLREPDNEHDANAIAVMKEEIHVGYIERDKAAWIAQFLEEQMPYTAVVERVEQRRNNLHPILTISFDLSGDTTPELFGDDEEDGE